MGLIRDRLINKRAFLLTVLLASGLLTAFFWKKGELLSPMGKIMGEKDIRNDYKVVGFLPTWMIGKTQNYCKELSHLVFLGVEVDKQGNLIWDVQGKKIDSDTFLRMKESVDRCGGKNILGIKLFEDNKIIALVANEEARINLRKQIKEVVIEKHFDGVNIDFEYQGNPVAVLENDFVSLLREIKSEGVGEVSLDVFANTVIKGDETKLKALLNEIDDLIVMAYDFHRPGVDFAGPVAPIRAPAGKRSILEVAEKIVASNLDREKIVMAYPLYGYEWDTIGEGFGAETGKSCVMASYRRVKELLESGEEVKVNLDEESMTPWLSYVKDGKTFQIYYEDINSLRKKFELVKQTDLGGVGFWALGYEGNHRDVWEELIEVF